ncbi:PQQ-binding-like beta-propeller repeat protein [Kitasatospora sp. NPDC094028]
MAGDHPTAGSGDTPGSGPQDHRGVHLGRQPGAVDPAAVADQMTQLDGSAVPGQAAPPAPAGPPPAQPPAAPAQPPVGGAEYAAYAPTAAGFPTQAPPPPPGAAPLGPYDPVPGGYPAPDAGQTYGGYNYQQQPGYYPGAPVPEAPKQRNPVMLWGGIIGGVLVIAIIIGLVVLLQPKPAPKPSDNTSGGTTSSSGSTTDGPVNNSPGPDTKSGASYNVAWSAPKPANTDTSSQMLAIWGTDKVAVRVDASGIRAYNLSDGKEAWTIPVPSGSKEICAASYGTNSKNIGAVSFNTGDYDCSTVGVVDLTTGKLSWSVKASADKMSSPTLSITDKVVAFASSSVGALNVDNGASTWNYSPHGKICTVNGRAAGAQIAVSERCFDNGDQKGSLQILNSETGAATSSQIPLTGSIERIDKVVSDQPLVLSMSSGANGDYILPFDKDNKPGNQMPAKEPGSDSLRLSGQSDAFTQNVVSGTTLYVQVSGSKAAINAYDLTTGKRIWSSTPPSSGSSIGGDVRLVAGTDKQGKVRAIVSQGYNKPARLVTLSQTDGSMTDLGTLAMPNGLDIGMSLSEYLIGDESNSVYAFRRSYSSDAWITKWKK